MNNGKRILVVISTLLILLTATAFTTRLLPKAELSITPISPIASLQQDRLNINAATQDQLEALPGIGPSLAKAIIAYREKNGNFEKCGDLLMVPGIGNTKLERIADLICVGG